MYSFALRNFVKKKCSHKLLALKEGTVLDVLCSLTENRGHTVKSSFRWPRVSGAFFLTSQLHG